MLFIAAADFIILDTYGYVGLLFVVVTCAYPHRMPRPSIIKDVVFNNTCVVCVYGLYEVPWHMYDYVLYCVWFESVTCVYICLCGLYAVLGVWTVCAYCILLC